MKRIFILIIVSSMIFVTFSCKDFLEFPPTATFNIDSVFSKYTNALKLVNAMYTNAVPYNFNAYGGLRMNGGAFASAITDEGQATALQEGYHVGYYYKGKVTASSTWTSGVKTEDDYSYKWKTIRKAYVLLENIDKVPDAPEGEIDRIKAECKLMIATVYFEMFKRYGGVPIVKHAFTGSEDSDEVSLARATLQQTYDFFMGLIDDVITNYDGKLPANYTSKPHEFGRLPMAFAYGLKARAKLYAASPLFNTDRPYMDFGSNNNLICFGQYKKDRWKEAADAATDAIEYCLRNGYKLVDEGVVGDVDYRATAMNYTVANIHYPSKGNTEVIWGTPHTVGEWKYYTNVRYFSGSYGYCCNLVPLNQVERYELNSTQPGEYKNWDNEMSFNTGAVDSDTEAAAKLKLAAAARIPYRGLDPRFHASVIYNGDSTYSKYGPTGDMDMADAYTAAGVEIKDKHGQLSTGRQQHPTILHYVRKFTRGYEETTGPSNVKLDIYMRMAELYLIRAEALNEYTDDGASIPAQVYTDLNFIRSRSGMVGVKNPVTDKKEMREIIAHERNIELFYEDHRWFDLRRTLMSEQKIPVMIYKIDIRKIYTNAADKWPSKITYKKVPLGKRYWTNSWYMNPFPKTEVDKFYGLIQNPGWE